MADQQDTNSERSDYDDTPSLIELFRSPNEILCEFGDVVLIADDGFHPILKIRVSSCLLATASKVFKALFRGSFAEGEALRSSAGSEPVDIYLRDQPQSLLALCELLHFRSDTQRLSPRSLFELALIADKYDCVGALRLVMSGMLKDVPAADVTSLIFCIAVAYILDDAVGFRELTQKLVLESPGLFLEHPDERTTILPSSILTSIQTQRAFVFQEFTQELTAFVEDYTNAAFALEVPNYSRKLAQILTSYQLWPLNPKIRSLRGCLDSVSDINMPTMQQDVYPRSQRDMLPSKFWTYHAYTKWDPLDNSWANSGSTSPTTPPPISPSYAPQPRVETPTQSDLVTLAKRARGSCVGLCLDCVKENSTCRVSHSEHELAEDIPKDMFWACRPVSKSQKMFYDGSGFNSPVELFA
ncbi:hypothetical protein Q7P37_004576 [Cladosporium fusiforme]